MARKVVRVDPKAEKLGRDLAAREGITLNEAVDVLIQAGDKHLAGGKSNGKSNGKTIKSAKGLTKQDQSYVKKYAKEKGLTEAEAITALVLTGISRRRALAKDKAKRTNGSPKKKKRKTARKAAAKKTTKKRSSSKKKKTARKTAKRKTPRKRR